jgi:voltage-gated potassium channel
MLVSTQLGIATLMVAGTVLIHLVGLAILLALLRRHRRSNKRFVTALGNSAAIVASAFGLFGLHTVEIWAWAILYLLLGALPDFEQALYFSTSTYVTIGYGDIVLDQNSRVLGAIEGANGIILLGWSTAFFFSVVDRLKLLERELEEDR